LSKPAQREELRDSLASSTIRVEIAKELDQIGRIVAVNLMLGLLTVIVGASGRFW
jgi:uncharacterized membrane protein